MNKSGSFTANERETIKLMNKLRDIYNTDKDDDERVPHRNPDSHAEKPPKYIPRKRSPDTP